MNSHLFYAKKTTKHREHHGVKLFKIEDDLKAVNLLLRIHRPGDALGRHQKRVNHLILVCL